MIFFGQRPAIGGHRGWPVWFADNSIEGISAAAEVADFIEVDVRQARGGELVIAHDAEVAGRAIVDSDVAVLRERGVVTLSEAREAAAGKPLNLELKVAFHDAETVAREVARRAKPNDLLTSFWWPAIDLVKGESPGISTGLLTDNDPYGAIDHAADVGHVAVAIEWRLISPATVRKARACGLAVIAWTVNGPEQINDLASWGVDAIITDDPGAATAVLRGGPR